MQIPDFRTVVIPVTLFISLVAYTFGLFTNYWGISTKPDEQFRFGLIEYCSTECTKPVDFTNDSLTFGVFGFCSLLNALGLSIYILVYRAKLTEATKNTLSNVSVGLGVTTVLLVLINWTRYYEVYHSRTEDLPDQKALFTFGSSFALVVSSSVFAFLALAAIFAQRFTYNDAYRFYLQIAAPCIYMLAVLLNMIGLFTEHWLKNKPTINVYFYQGFFESCLDKTCRDFYLNHVYAFALIGFYFLCEMNVLVYLYNENYLKFERENRVKYWTVLMILFVFCIVMMISGWGTFAHYKESDKDVIFTKALTIAYGWSFYFCVLSTIALLILAFLFGYLIRNIGYDSSASSATPTATPTAATTTTTTTNTTKEIPAEP